MSYFSHNPEAWDEICIKAMTRKLCGNAGEDDEIILEKVEFILSELYHTTNDPKAKKVIDALLDWSHEQLRDQEQSYWNKFIP